MIDFRTPPRCTGHRTENLTSLVAVTRQQQGTELTPQGKDFWKSPLSPNNSENSARSTTNTYQEPQLTMENIKFIETLGFVVL